MTLPWILLAFAAAATEGQSAASPWGRTVFEQARADSKVVAVLLCSPAAFACSSGSLHRLESTLSRERFLVVRTDPEARPDLEEICARQSLAPSPLVCFLTANGHPIAAIALSSEGAILRRAESRAAELAKAWRKDRAGSIALARGNLASLHAGPRSGGQGAPDKVPLATLEAEAEGVARLPWLLALADLSGTIHREARPTLEGHLDRLARDTARDYVAGGFHRTGPRSSFGFEKLLSDNALLLRAYAVGHSLSGSLFFRHIAEETVAWLTRDMRQASGTFRTSIAAASGGGDGGYYVWDRAEIEKALGPDRSREFFSAYTLAPSGLLALMGSPFAGLEDSRAVLMNRRNRRVRSPTDERTLVGWNGLTIGALATSGRLLGRGSDIETARRAALALLEAAGPAAHLRHVLDGPPGGAFLEDYAFLAAGLLDLHQATSEISWLTAARGLTDAAVLRFWDPSGGGFFSTDATHVPVIARVKSIDDLERPSANAVMVRVLTRLSRLTRDKRYSALATKTVEAFRDAAETASERMPSFVAAVAEWRAATEQDKESADSPRD